MKKSLLSLVAFVFGISAFAGIANWLSISDIFSNGEPSVNTAYTQLLNDYSPEWWYLDGVSLTCEVSENGGITITSPRIGDSIDETAPAYRLFLSPYRISQIKDGEPSVDNWNIKMIEQKVDSNISEVSFKLSSTDVSESQAYYGFITPLDMYDVVWTPSKEICFQINKNVCMLDTECDTFDLVVNPVSDEHGSAPEANPEANPEETNPEVAPEDTHGSADCISMEYANVRHTSDGKNITLTWTAVAGGGDVDIAIFNPDDEVFEKIATVKMSDEKYVYPMRWNGVQNFILTNECWQAKYKADEGIKEWEPEKIVTPATGPAENIMYIAIAAIILYGAYAIFFRKSDN